MRQRKSIIRYLPVFGCIATGVLYGGIGLIALLSFFKVRDGGADESSMLLVLNDVLVGQILILLILGGTMCYVAWRVFEVVTDPYDYGRHWKGIGRRIGIALSTVADVLVVSSGVRVLLGTNEIQTNGMPIEERAMAKSLLDAGEAWVVILLGVVIFATAVLQLVYGVTKGYRERVDKHGFGPISQKSLHFLGLYGYSARGVILAIIGYFFVAAGLQHDPEIVVNTDKAFDFIGDNVGHVFFIVAALGTIAYGAFMVMLGVTYKASR